MHGLRRRLESGGGGGAKGRYNNHNKGILKKSIGFQSVGGGGNGSRPSHPLRPCFVFVKISYAICKLSVVLCRMTDEGSLELFSFDD